MTTVRTQNERVWEGDARFGVQKTMERATQRNAKMPSMACVVGRHCVHECSRSPLLSLYLSRRFFFLPLSVCAKVTNSSVFSLYYKIQSSRLPNRCATQRIITSSRPNDGTAIRLLLINLAPLACLCVLALERVHVRLSPGEWKCWLPGDVSMSRHDRDSRISYEHEYTYVHHSSNPICKCRALFSSFFYS